ncbi:hypothetical protein M9H77_13600 [Catharanthus roseus]|uniref:Uncharacterized protein n=1 Tax=Catharanthus roseus TaxID=4058 RepID=A0ACC0BKV1_CATRO|nr:hypothetical protein M9H77_13600 [Catharanthus roseus]
MDATHPVRVVLFWDSEIARDAYGLYFTGLVQKTWTFYQMVSHAELIRKILKYRDIDPNQWSVRMTMRVPSFYEENIMFYFTLYSMNNDNEMLLVEFIPLQRQIVSITHATNTINMTENVTTLKHIVYDEPSMLYPTVDDDDDENGHSDKEYVISSESESDGNNDTEEEELQTVVNPVIENTVTQ